MAPLQMIENGNGFSEPRSNYDILLVSLSARHNIYRITEFLLNLYTSKQGYPHCYWSVKGFYIESFLVQIFSNASRRLAVYSLLARDYTKIIFNWFMWLCKCVSLSITYFPLSHLKSYMVGICSFVSQ